MAEERDAEKRARRSSETLGDDVPNAREVGALAGNHEHRRLFKGIRPRPVLCQRNREVLDGSSRLPLTVARRHNPPLRVERTGPR
ncbi:MAG: hypothetical protein WB761_02440 [Solirubrobacteraceae bacterium]